MWNEKVSATSFCLKFNGDRCPVFPCRDSRSLAWWFPGDFKRCQLGRSWGSIQPDLRICYIYRSYRYIPWICLIVKIADGGGPWHSAGIGPAGGRKGKLTVGEYLATSVPIVPFGTTNSDDYLVVTAWTIFEQSIISKRTLPALTPLLSVWKLPMTISSLSERSTLTELSFISLYLKK